MMRETSAKAYNQIREEGLLTKLRFTVYRALYRAGPMTAQETWHYLRDEAARNGEARINGITPRFSELQLLGVISEVGKRPCKITGRDCILWDVTKNLPKKVDVLKSTKPTRKQLVKLVCAYRNELRHVSDLCAGRGLSKTASRIKRKLEETKDVYIRMERQKI